MDSSTSKPILKNFNNAFKYKPSKLRIMECADYVSVEVKPAVFCVQPPKGGSEPPDHIFGQADEEIEADNPDFYEPSDAESSYEEDTTDYTSTWTTQPKPAENPKAAFLAQFSEDNDGSKAKPPANSKADFLALFFEDNDRSKPKPGDNPKAAFLAQFSEDNHMSKAARKTSVVKWLEASAEIHDQENFTHGSAETQGSTSGNIEVDKQSRDEVSCLDCEAEPFHLVSGVEAMLGEDFTVVDKEESRDKGLEKTEESTPLSSPLSECFISTNSTLSSESVAKKAVKEDKMARLDGTASSKEAVFSGYPEIFAHCDHIDKLVAQEVAAWRENAVGFRTQEPSHDQELDFKMTSEKNLEEMSEKRDEGT